jgi:hypothetical protein
MDIDMDMDITTNLPRNINRPDLYIEMRVAAAKPGDDYFNYRYLSTGGSGDKGNDKDIARVLRHFANYLDNKNDHVGIE